MSITRVGSLQVSACLNGCFAVAACIASSCATAPVGAGTSAGPVQFDSFAVPAPEGKDWGLTQDPKAEAVTFHRVTIPMLVGKVVASTEIRVFKVPITEAASALAEDELADGFCEQERAGMIAQGVSKGAYKLKKLDKGVEWVAGRKLYTMRYQTQAPGSGAMPILGDSALFLYFPPDYGQRRAFYGFLIAESWEKGNIYASPDLKRIEPVIAGFELR
jgi:hypothetical protein